MNWLEQYQKINASFTKTCVFRVGAEAGFFSEYNNMILALLLCLNYRIQFRLTSIEGNFAVEKGLTDYLIPFCPEDNRWYSCYFNSRPWVFNGKIRRFLCAPVKLLYGINYFTQDVWEPSRSKEFQKEQFDYPQLNIKGDLLQAASVVVQHTWRLQPVVQKEINEAIALLDLPKDYVAFHIRRGDKFPETKLTSTEDYFRKAEQTTDLRSAFIATDDYRVIDEVKQNFPNWKIYTLCSESARGHLQKTFNDQTKENIYKSMIKILTDIELLYAAQISFVTYSSNWGMFLGMRRGYADHPQIHSVDLPNWQVW